ncbi:hypothetical protein [Winogradskyella ursingii]|uniref:hypothetical protein n=1 Tax=Winogradskyella ursingii TaxID=2686079 RepID=UPI0015C93017|nr:hypothetical protein [Winogradskyella ursingii]
MDLPEGYHREDIRYGDYERAKVQTYLLNRGGPNFETYSLHISQNNNLYFRLSPRLGFQTLVLFVIPFLFIGFILYKFSTTGSFHFLINDFIYYSIISYICIRFIVNLISKLKYYTFSKAINFYFVGFPLLPVQLAYKKYALEDIIAIQILGEELIGIERNSKRRSFELNLVLKSLDRIHVIDHNNLEGMLDDAKLLGEYLNIPIWHAKSAEENK